MVGVLAICCCEHSLATVYDLQANWSDTNNPNGVWTLRYGSDTLSSAPAQDLGFDVSQTAWRNGFLPAWLKNNGSYNITPHDTVAGDIIVHTLDGYNGGSNAGANVKWQSPSDGFATISGGVWSVNNLGRANHWELFRNDSSLSRGSVFDGGTATRADPFQFSNGSGGASAITSIPVRQGDLISLNLSKLSPDGDFVGVNLSISLKTPEPSALVQLDPHSTYLKLLTGGDLANLSLVQDAKKIDLANDLPFAVQPGDWIRLRAFGKFKFAPASEPPDPDADPGPYDDGTLRDAFGVFSSSGYLDPDKTVSNRVPNAVGAEGIYVDEINSGANDIPDDFWISSNSSQANDGQGMLVQVPVGAQYLFLGAADTQWYDNTLVEPDLNYGVSITKLYAGRFLGDYNFDEVVDSADYVLWRKTRGQTGVGLASDGNLDGTINDLDYFIWKENFGREITASSNSVRADIGSVPEPHAGVVLIISAIYFGFCRRRKNGCAG